MNYIVYAGKNATQLNYSNVQYTLKHIFVIFDTIDGHVSEIKIENYRIFES